MHVCAAAFGTPHRRRRFYLVASLHSDARDVLLSQVRLLPPTIWVLPIHHEHATDVCDKV